MDSLKPLVPFKGGRSTLERSTLSGNRTLNENAPGGGVYSTSGDIMVTDSTVYGNSTAQFNSPGGGIRTFLGDLTLTRSTVSDNFTLGDFSHGGGISPNRELRLFDSTISGNRTEGDTAFGGGIRASDSVRIYGSTITNNSTSGLSADGGGIQVSDLNAFFLLQNSIIAGNTALNANAPDLRPDPSSVTIDVDYSLIGDTSSGLLASQLTEINNGTGNLLDVDPLLGPLASLGGPTQTHALLTGSPAIDAGNSTRTTDQRGLPAPDDLVGVVNAVGGNGSDIGAYERQTSLAADFDLDDDVDGLDFLIWQRGFGTPNANRTDGDSDGDSDVDADDLAAWEAGFGSATPTLAASVDNGQAGLSREALIDAAIALEWFDATIDDKPSYLVGVPIVESVIDSGDSITELAPVAAIQSETDLVSRQADASAVDERPWLTEELLDIVWSTRA